LPRSVSEIRPVVGFGISGVEPSYSATGQLISKMELSEYDVRMGRVWIWLNIMPDDVFSTDTRRLTTGIRSEKCVVRRFRRRANVYLHKPRYYSITDFTPRLYGIAYCLLLGYKPVQHVTVLNTVGNCNTVVSIII
jgi:hypothetical protein